jgi:hypothetical protein
MSAQESRKHHYVPEFLLRPWLSDIRGENVLCGYHWHPHRNELAVKRRGLNSFCFQLDLLSLRQHQLGRDAIEKIFFGEIDTQGTKARDLLIEKGASALNGDQRCSFARLLLSLDARRPHMVDKIRAAKDWLADNLNSDSEVIAVAEAVGIKERPSEFLERHTGVLLEDRAIGLIQKLVDNPKVGGRLINSTWAVVRFKGSDETLILSDRPLIRFFGYEHENALWILPLEPHAAFVAANDAANVAKLNSLSTNRLAKQVNVASANQAESFVFSVSDSHRQWLPKYLRPAPVGDR